MAVCDVIDKLLEKAEEGELLFCKTNHLKKKKTTKTGQRHLNRQTSQHANSSFRYLQVHHFHANNVGIWHIVRILFGCKRLYSLYSPDFCWVQCLTEFLLSQQGQSRSGSAFQRPRSATRKAAGPRIRTSSVASTVGARR